MEIAVVALTKTGTDLARRLKALYPGPCTVYGKADGDDPLVQPLAGRLADLLPSLFGRYRGLVLVMATGIAVRLLAPLLQSKKTDPAVVVVDEGGRFAISLLSGHLGGANALARQVAELLGAQAVITTASDVRGLPALDLLARDLGLVALPPRRLTRAAAVLVEGGRFGIWAEEHWLKRLEQAAAPLPVFPITELEPQGWEGGVLVTSRRLALPGPNWLFLRPRELVAGVGCGRGVGAVEILRALRLALRLAGRSIASLRCLATVDFKAAEPGLVAAARLLRLELVTFSPGEIGDLLAARPELSRSQRVAARIGVGGICEPCALLAARNGRLILGKICHARVTVALAGVA